MKLNRGVFPGRKPATAQLSGFKACNSFPFNKTPDKTAPFSAVSGERISRARRNRGAIEGEAMKLSVSELPVDELGLAYGGNPCAVQKIA